MNTSEAYDILAKRLAELFDYEDLSQRLESNPAEEFTVRGKSGVNYHVNVQVAWESKLHDKIRMTGSVVPVDKNLAEPLVQILLVPKPRGPKT